jgi:hypothetical protein
MHVQGSDADVPERRRLECADIAFVLGDEEAPELADTGLNGEFIDCPGVG